MERCTRCQTPLESGTQFCPRCGSSQPQGILEAQTLQGRQTAAFKPCPKCQAVQPESASFCGDCGYAFSQPLRLASGQPLPPAFVGPEVPGGGWGSGALRTSPASGGILPAAPVGPQSGAVAVPGAPAWPQSGGVHVPGTPAGLQSGGIGVPHTPGWPQGGAPGVPGAAAAPQSGAPGVPGAPAGAQSGALAAHGVRATNTVGKRLGHFVRRTLLGTLQAKIITAIVALGVIGTTGGVVYVTTTRGQDGAVASYVGPANSANFMLAVDIKTVDGLGHAREFQETLIVKNGSVCQARDDGKLHTLSNGYIQVIDGLGTPYQEKLTARCQGAYQNGKLTYTETVSYLENDFPADIICDAHTPLVLQQLSGTFTSATKISGSFSAAPSSYMCSLGYQASFPKKDGSWSGNVR